MHWLYGLIYWWMLSLLGCLILGIEWDQVRKRRAFTARHSKHSLSPVTLALLHCCIIALLVVKLLIFRFLEGKAWPTRHLSVFLTGMLLFSPSMMDSLFYEPNGGSMMLRFCVFLIFSTMCKMVLWFSMMTIKYWQL
jgi:hypothetical protein